MDGPNPLPHRKYTPILRSEWLIGVDLRTDIRKARVEKRLDFMLIIYYHSQRCNSQHNWRDLYNHVVTPKNYFNNNE